MSLMLVAEKPFFEKQVAAASRIWVRSTFVAVVTSRDFVARPLRMDLGLPEIELDGTGNDQLPDSQGSLVTSAARRSPIGRINGAVYFPCTISDTRVEFNPEFPPRVGSATRRRA